MRFNNVDMATSTSLNNTSPSLRILIGGFIILAFVSNPERTYAQSAVWDVTIQGSNTFSSARAVDLNGDQILDIVVGSGRELAQESVGVLAFDGADGSVLWQTETRSQIFGSPIFHDINEDGIPDVFIGGRRSQFYCINGLSGEVIWEATPCASLPDCFSDSLPNYYTGQWIGDLNGDSYPEILNVRGGYAPANPNDPNRPAGQVVILDGRTGETLRQYDMPDGKESYCSPTVWRADGHDDAALFGSGGETVPGSAWKVSIQGLWNGSPIFEQVINATEKGVMAPVSISDLNMDGIPDMIVQAFDGRISAVDGGNGEVFWTSMPYEGNESSTSPCIGYFNADNVPDVAVNYVTGVFPQYTGGHHCILDGSNGDILWSSDQPLYPFHTPVAANFGGNGQNDFFFMTNYYQSGLVSLRLLQVNGYDSETYTLLEESASVNLASTPLVCDLDGNGLLDLVIVSTSHPNNLFSEENMRMRRFETNYAIDDSALSWSGYMGTVGDATFDNFSASPVAITGMPIVVLPSLHPNPFKDRIQISGTSRTGVSFEICDLFGRSILSGFTDARNAILNLELAQGVYLLTLQDSSTVAVFRVISER
jgi:outer membrane protein assembly factor BamB